MIISLVILLGGSELHQDEVGFDPNSDSIAHLQGQSFFAMEDDLTFYSLSNGAQLQSLLPRRADEGCSAAGLITDLSDLLDLDQVSLIRIPDALVETSCSCSCSCCCCSWGDNFLKTPLNSISD